MPRHAPADDLRLLHKTTDRSLYRDALQRGGTYEVALIDAQGYLTECCFSSIFVERGDKLLTPPRSRGLNSPACRQDARLARRTSWKLLVMLRRSALLMV